MTNSVRFRLRLGVAAFITLSACAACSDPAVAPPDTAPEKPAPEQGTLVNEGVGARSFEGTVGTTISVGPTIRVLRSNGTGKTPASGITVRFVAFMPRPDGSASGVRLRDTITDSQGIASLTDFRFDTVAQSYRISGIVEGLQPPQFTITALPGPVAQLTIVSGDRQKAAPGGTLSYALGVRGLDAFGNPTRGTPVSFSVSSGGGSISSETAQSDWYGLAISGRWTLGADGTQEVRAHSGDIETVFTAEFCVNGQPCAASPQLAFVRDEQVLVSESQGSNANLLAMHGLNPSWAPDGSRIAFVRSGNDKSQICIAQTDGSGERCTLYEFGAYIPGPLSWSPDGSELVFTSAAAQTDSYELPAASPHLLNTATMQFSALDTPPLFSLSLSPDGKKIAFVGADGLGMMNRDGSEREIIKSQFGSWLPRRVAWSPNGEKLALIVMDQTCVFGCLLAVGVTDVRADNFSLLPLSLEEYDQLDGVAWSPEGRITYTRTAMRQVMSIAPTGGPVSVLLTNATSAAWRPVDPR